MTLPLASVITMRSGIWRLAGMPLAVAPENSARLKRDSGCWPAPPLPADSGDSSIHSAVSPAELYGTVVWNVQLRVSFLMVMSQTAPLLPSTAALMKSPAPTGNVPLSSGPPAFEDGAGITSHHAE